MDGFDLCDAAICDGVDDVKMIGVVVDGMEDGAGNEDVIGFISDNYRL